MTTKTRGYLRGFTPAPGTSGRRYLLDNIPAGFWTQVRAKATRDGVSMRGLILQLVDLWLRGDVQLPKTEEGR